VSLCAINFIQGTRPQVPTHTQSHIQWLVGWVDCRAIMAVAV